MRTACIGGCGSNTALLIIDVPTANVWRRVVVRGILPDRVAHIAAPLARPRIDLGLPWSAMINEVKAVWPWMGNVVEAVYTVGHGMWVTFRTWIKAYRPERKTFTEHFEYPELPVPVAARYRGFHRFDLTTCIACDQCAKACPVDCIYIGKERVEGGKGFKITGYTIDYTKCMFCALCVEPCPVDCIFMGATHDLSCYSRDGCIVDFARMPLDVAWGRATLNPAAVAESKVIVTPVHGGPNQ